MPLPVCAQVIGMDVGLTHFATLSTGEQLPNPWFFRTDEKALTKARRRLAQAPGDAITGETSQSGGAYSRTYCQSEIPILERHRDQPGRLDTEAGSWVTPASRS
jgi:hypothetical protein